MNSGIKYYFKVSNINRIKNFKRKPFKSVGMLVLGIYFVFLPLFLKGIIKGMNLDNPKGYIGFIAVLSIYIGMPSMLSYFKRKGLVFTEADINFTFTSPITPKENLLIASINTILLSVVQYMAYMIAAYFIFRIPLYKAILVALVGVVFTNIINNSLVIIMYGSENLNNKTKNIIRYLVYIILISITALIVFNVTSKGVSFKNIMNIFSGDLIMLVPIFGWEIGFLKFVLVGPSVFNIITTGLYFISVLILLIYAKSLKIKGEYYEDALSFSEEYSRILEKSKKEGSIEWVGKKDKIKNISFSKKGSYSKAIFYKQLDEFKKISIFKKYGKVLAYMLISGITGFFIKKDLTESLDLVTVLLVAYIVSIYFGIFFSKGQSWKKEYESFYIYLFPDKARSKMFYSTLFQIIRYFIEGIALALPINIIFKFPIYYIILNVIIYTSVQIMILYVDFILREIVGSKIGENLAYMVMIGVDFFILLLGGGLAFCMYFLTKSVLVSFIFLVIYLLGIACLGLVISSRLYTNMEFVNE